MEKRARPKTAKSNVMTWSNCLYVGKEWEKSDIYGNGIYNAFFLVHGKTMQKFRLWGCSTLDNALEFMEPLTPCTIKSHWYRNWKWLENVTVEEAKNDN